MQNNKSECQTGIHEEISEMRHKGSRAKFNLYRSDGGQSAEKEKSAYDTKHTKLVVSRLGLACLILEKVHSFLLMM